MSVKYRIRLANERVVGPFNEQEVIELFEKDHIAGDEFCQLFPIGDWKSLSSFPNIYEKIEEIKVVRANAREEERLAEEARKEERIDRHQKNQKNQKKGKHEITQSAIKVFKEFKFEQGAKVDVDYKELEKKHRLEKLNMPYEEDGIEKTIILHRKRNVDNIDKTILIKNARPSIIHKMDLKKVQEKIEAEHLVKLDKHEEERKSKELLISEQTQFIDLNEVLPSINAQLKASEVEFEKIAKIEENEEKFKQRQEKEREKERVFREAMSNVAEDEELVQDKFGSIIGKKKRVKGMSWIVVIAFIAIIYNLLFPEEAPKQVGPVYLPVEFPAANPSEDIQKAKEEYATAKALYNENTYIKRVLASSHFVASLKYKFSDNQALGDLILNYSELMENASKQSSSVGDIYKLIRVAERDMYRDLSTATGAALFYGKIGKANTGVVAIKNYLRVGSKPNVKMLGVYLDLLISSGELKEAREVFDKIKDTPKKPMETFLPLARFLETNENLAEAQNIIEDGLKYFPNSAMLLLKEANLLLKAQSVQKFEETLNRLNAIHVERSPMYLAEYLKYQGMLKALKNKNQEAAIYFKKSLEIKEDEDLRMRFAELDVGGNAMSQHLILESKIISLIKRAKEEIKNKNWDQAAIVISEAVDADPSYVPAVLVLADLQVRRGLFEAAIHTLMNVKDKNPNNYQILSSLIKVYLKAYKFEDAQRLLVEGSQSKFSQTSDYFYLYGMFFEGKQNIVYAVKYYDRSLALNPVSDAILFKLATIYFKNKQFADAKKKLADALFLDPKNTEYISLYAQIINEQDNADTAIGYLRDVINEMGEDPKLLSTITEIYFRSGQLKEFKTYYSRVQNLPKKDEGFYEYLISASRLDESYDEFEKYSKELLKINPGNLKVKMNLAEYYIEKNKHQEAQAELLDIKEKLPSYPKVHFMLAKNYLSQGDIKDAKEMAALELKMNPSLDSAYYIMGEVYRQNREYREAVANFEKAISKNPKGLDAMMALAWIKLNQNLASEALDLYTRAIKFDPTNPEVHKQLGYTYKALGQRAVAKEKFEDYLKLNPAAVDKPQIEQIIRSLK